MNEGCDKCSKGYEPGGNIPVDNGMCCIVCGSHVPTVHKNMRIEMLKQAAETSLKCAVLEPGSEGDFRAFIDTMLELVRTERDE